MRVAIVVALLLWVQPAVAAGATVVAHGHAPDAVVDRDGITHLVWNEVRSSGLADVLHYCQIPAGGSACTNAQSFVPAGVTPVDNTDFFGPHVMVTPFGEVILLTNRCCFGLRAPNLVYVSDDGGLTFGAPTQVGSVAPGQQFEPSPALFDGADRRLVTIGGPGSGASFQAAPLGQYTEAYADLGATAARHASVVQPARNSFAAAWATRAARSEWARSRARSTRARSGTRTAPPTGRRRSRCRRPSCRG